MIQFPGSRLLQRLHQKMRRSLASKMKPGLKPTVHEALPNLYQSLLRLHQTSSSKVTQRFDEDSTVGWRSDWWSRAWWPKVNQKPGVAIEDIEVDEWPKVTELMCLFLLLFDRFFETQPINNWSNRRRTSTPSTSISWFFYSSGSCIRFILFSY